MNPQDASPGAAAAPRRIALLEVHDRDGRLVQSIDVTHWPLTLGRALDNDVALADPHIAPYHARIAPDDSGRPTLVALASRNGVRVELETGGARHVGGGEQAMLAPRARLRLGQTLLSLRLPDDPLPAELPLAPLPGSAPSGSVALLGALVAAWTLAAQWLDRDPDSRWLDYLVPLLAVGGGLAAWVLIWALLTKLFRGHFDVRPHLLLTLAFALAIGATELVLPALAFALDWPLLSRVSGLAAGLLAAGLFAAQLSLVVPRHSRVVRLVTAGVVVLAAGVQMVTTWQQQDRLFGELYAPMLLPPSWRLAPAQPVDELTQRLRTLENPLRERARRAQTEDFEP